MTHKQPRKGLKRKEEWLIIKEIAARLKDQQYSNYLDINNHNHRKIIFEMMNKALKQESMLKNMMWFSNRVTSSGVEIK